MKTENFHRYINNSAPEGQLIKATSLGGRAEFGLSLGFHIETKNSENLKELPPNSRTIFLVTHLSDYDVPLAIAGLAKYISNMKVADASTHADFKKSPVAHVVREIAEKDNFINVDFTGGRGSGSGNFNPKNYELMKQTLEEGYSLVLAAYYDTSYQNHQWRLPETGGIGGVYLAQITSDSVIVPVAVDIKSEPFGMGQYDLKKVVKQHPRVEVTIGRPVMLNKIENVRRFGEILGKTSHRTATEDRADFRRIRPLLEEQSKLIMSALAEMLPEEKRPKKRE